MTSELDSPPPASLSQQLIEYYREVVRDHRLDPRTGRCPICEAEYCSAGKFAAERLSCAGDEADDRADDGLEADESA